MKEFVEYLVKAIVTSPDEVMVTEDLQGQEHLYLIKVSPTDMGIVIGKEGKTIRAIRNLAKAKAIKDNIMIRVVLEEDGIVNSYEKEDIKD